MEFVLRCNVLKCRKELNDHAIVTTCSHVFCQQCSTQYQLSGQTDGQRRTCPACEIHLPNHDDVVFTNLNPTEDYKTSVLSGLGPNIIMECVGRALSFWAYQATMEIVYQEYLAKNLTDKFSALNTQTDKIIHDANSEISNLRNKIQNMQVDQDTLRRRNEELTQAFREKSRKQMQTQELYDKLKRRSMLGQVQEAASDAVDHTVQASAMGNRFVDRVTSQNPNQYQYQRQRAPPPPPPLYSDQPSVQIQRPGGLGTGINNMAPPAAQPRRGDTAWAGFSSQGNPQNPAVQTPLHHRQPLVAGNLATPQIKPNAFPNLAAPQQRSPLTGLNPNSRTSPGFAGYGLSAGLKVSNPAGVGVNAGGVGLARPLIRSRVAQRPAGPAISRTPAFGPSATPNIFSNGGQFY